MQARIGVSATSFIYAPMVSFLFLVSTQGCAASSDGQVYIPGDLQVCWQAVVKDHSIHPANMLAAIKIWSIPDAIKSGEAAAAKELHRRMKI